MKKLISLAVAFTLVLSGCGAKSSDDLQKVSLVLDYTPNTNHTGIYVAKEKGYYKDAGLNVEINQPSENGAEGMVASNKADFGISYGENVAQFDDENNQLTSIMSLVAHNTSGFLSRKETNITRPKDFEGKTYCGWGSDIESAIIKTLVSEDGGDPSKVKINSSAAADLKNKNSGCDLIWAYEGWDKVDMDLNKIPTNYLPLTDYGVDWYTPVIIASNEKIKQDPKEVQAFVDATIKGYDYAIKHPDESADILLKAAPELDEEQVKQSQKFLSANYKDDSQKMGYQKDKMWNSFIKWLKENKVVSDDLKVEDLYTNQFIK